jgi:hypothetical protein
MASLALRLAQLTSDAWLEDIMSPRTLFLSKLIGLYCILGSLSMMTHREVTLQAVTELLHSPALRLVLGVVTLVAGLAMVLVHNVWSGGALPVIVTIVGWATLIKGSLFFFLLPETEARAFLGVFHYQQLSYVYMAISLVIGIYLTYRGFMSPSR